MARPCPCHTNLNSSLACLLCQVHNHPENLTGLAPNQAHRKERVDWTLWKEVLKRANLLTRLPGYGDYAIQHPTIPPGGFIGSANIRYTQSDHWMIFRGRKVTSEKAGGYEQYRHLAQIVSNYPGFSGARFSWGDKLIKRCAQDASTPTGNQSTWRGVGTSHHLAFVMHQLSNQVGS